MKDYKIFVINPGSTSTKVAMFKGKEKIYSENIQHDVSELKAFKEVRDQLDYRRDMILESVKKSGETLTDVDAFSSRGGGCGTTESGVFTINETLLDYVTNRPSVVHPAILGAPIASALAEKYHAKAFIVNPPEVDEFKDLARVTGLKGVYRKSAIHALNQKEIGLRYAQKVGKNYSDLNLIICHIGGGISITAHEKGRMVDSNDIARGDGPMAPTRAAPFLFGMSIECVIPASTVKRDAGKSQPKTAALPITWAQAMPGKSKSGPMQEMRTQR